MAHLVCHARAQRYITCHHEYDDTLQDEAIRYVGCLIKQAGMDRIKLEVTCTQASIAKANVDAGIAVIGHIRLTPQTSASLGGMNVIDAQSVATTQRIVNDALAMHQPGDGGH